MRRLPRIASGSAAAVVSFFAIHHLDSSDVAVALREWHRVLCKGGQLVLAAWAGTGRIDYGDTSDVVAFMHSDKELAGWAGDAGFRVERCRLEAVEDMGMDAVYVSATKA